MKTVAELIEAHRNLETRIIQDYIISKGGNGLCCTEEPCGCPLDDLFMCDLDPEDCDACVPAKSGPGEWEGEPAMLFFPIEEDEDATD